MNKHIWDKESLVYQYYCLKCGLWFTSFTGEPEGYCEKPFEKGEEYKDD